MNPRLLEILNVFSESPSDWSVFEDTHQMELTFGVTKADMHLPSSFPLELIAARDGMTIRWNYMELDDEDNVAYMSEKDPNKPQNIAHTVYNAARGARSGR